MISDQCSKMEGKIQEASITSTIPLNNSDNHDYHDNQNHSLPFNSNKTLCTSTLNKNDNNDNVNKEEQQYLELVTKIINEGTRKENRTGTDTLSIFGHQMRFNLSNNQFPLLTTKRVFFKGVLEELLWFIRGDTNNNHLQDRGVHVWDGNSTRSFLDSRGLIDREEGDLGPIYGFQWRHFGASYTDMYADYKNQGIDQLNQVLHTIRTNPNDRRMIVSSWNPVDLPLMALPPCHVLFQFYVADGKLSCQMYQRSCDVGLGVPFNTASYSLLNVMMAWCANLEPGEFIHTMGDSHVYLDHVEPLLEQCKRVPKPFPKLYIKPGTQRERIDGFKADDFDIVGYEPHGKINMKMAV